MKPIGNGQSKSRFKGMRLSSQAMMCMVAASSLMSLVTLMLVLYSFHAIPANVEQRRDGRTEELQALTQLVDSVSDLSKIAVEMTNARTDAGRNPR